MKMISYSKIFQFLLFYLNENECNLNKESIVSYELVLFNEIFRKFKIFLHKIRLKKFKQLQPMLMSLCSTSDVILIQGSFRTGCTNRSEVKVLID